MTAPFEALTAQGRAWMAVYPAGTRACVFVTWPAGRGSRAQAREFTAGHVIDAVHAADPGPARQLSFDLTQKDGAR